MKNYNSQSLVVLLNKVQVGIWLQWPLIYFQTLFITTVCSSVKLLQFSPNTTLLTFLQLNWLDADRERKGSSGRQ